MTRDFDSELARCRRTLAAVCREPEAGIDICVGWRTPAVNVAGRWVAYTRTYWGQDLSGEGETPQAALAMLTAAAVEKANRQVAEAEKSAKSARDVAAAVEKAARE